MKSFLFILILSMTSLQAFAKDEVAERFRNSAVSTLKSALARNIEHVDGVSLREALEKVEKVNIIANAPITMSVGGRRCAMWQNFSKQGILPTITINEKCRELSDEELKPIALHEVLGATLGKDLNYEITTELLFPPSDLNLKKKRDAQMSKIKKMNQENESAYEKSHRSGGSTVVGGGGDGDDIYFKMVGLKYLEDMNPKSSLYNVPIELLKIALKKMLTAPASDISYIFEVRRPGIDSNYRDGVVYVNSSLYRSRDLNLGPLAVLAARLYVMYMPDQLHIAESNPLFVGGDRKWVTPLINRPYIFIHSPSVDPIVLTNRELTQSMSEDEKATAFATAMATGKDDIPNHDFMANYIVLVRNFAGQVEKTK